MIQPSKTGICFSNALPLSLQLHHKNTTHTIRKHNQLHIPITITHEVLHQQLQKTNHFFSFTTLQNRNISQKQSYLPEQQGGLSS